MWRFAIVVALASLAFAVPGGAAARTSPGVEGVHWGGVHFTSKEQLSKWLAARGVSYADWGRRHPLGLYLMTHPPAAPLTPPADTPPAGAGLAGTVHPPAGRSPVAAAAFLTLASLLLAVAITGRHLARLAPARLDPEQIPVARVAAAAGSAALLSGAALVWWL